MILRKTNGRMNGYYPYNQMGYKIRGQHKGKLMHISNFYFLVYLRLDFSLRKALDTKIIFWRTSIEITLQSYLQSVLTKWNDNSLDVWFIAFDLLLFECYIVAILLHLWMILESRNYMLHEPHHKTCFGARQFLLLVMPLKA